MPLASSDTLKERGWEEPLDKSPIDAPDGWGGGTVIHTGGGIYCRVWTTRTDAQRDTDNPEPGVYYEAIYGCEFDGATIDVYEYNEDAGTWEQREELARLQCDEQTDRDCADTAARLMENQNPPTSE